MKQTMTHCGAKAGHIRGHPDLASVELRWCFFIMDIDSEAVRRTEGTYIQMERFIGTYIQMKKPGMSCHQLLSHNLNPKAFKLCLLRS